MRNPGASAKAPVVPLDRHPAITRWMAELRRQQRRARRAPDAAGPGRRPATR